MVNAAMASSAHYKQLLADLYASDDDALYQRLMSKERDVLDAINRVTNERRGADVRSELFHNLPVTAVIQRMHSALSDVGRELLKARTVHDVVAIVRKDDRVIYVGLLVVVVALFLLLVQGDG